MQFLCECKAKLVYEGCSKTIRAGTQRNPVSKKIKFKKRKEKNFIIIGNRDSKCAWDLVDNRC